MAAKNGRKYIHSFTLVVDNSPWKQYDADIIKVANARLTWIKYTLIKLSAWTHALDLLRKNLNSQWTLLIANERQTQWKRFNAQFMFHRLSIAFYLDVYNIHSIYYFFRLFFSHFLSLPIPPFSNQSEIVAFYCSSFLLLYQTKAFTFALHLIQSFFSFLLWLSLFLSFSHLFVFFSSSFSKQQNDDLC